MSVLSQARDEDIQISRRPGRAADLSHLPSQTPAAPVRQHGGEQPQSGVHAAGGRSQLMDGLDPLNVLGALLKPLAEPGDLPLKEISDLRLELIVALANLSGVRPQARLIRLCAGRINISNVRGHKHF